MSVVPVSKLGDYFYVLLPSFSRPKAIGSPGVITPSPAKHTHSKTCIPSIGITPCRKTQLTPEAHFLVILLVSLWDIFSFASHAFSQRIMKAAGYLLCLWF